MIKKEKTINSKLIYDGKLLKFYVDDVIAQSDEKAIREHVKHPGGVCILAFIDNKIIMEKQYRYPYDEIIYELPAGKLEKNEDPIVSAKRELEEETGYRANSVTSYGYIYPTVGYTNEVIHLFVAKDLVKTETHFDRDEYVETVLLTIDEVKELINKNIIKDSKTICLLSKYLFSEN